MLLSETLVRYSVIGVTIILTIIPFILGLRYIHSHSEESVKQKILHALIILGMSIWFFVPGGVLYLAVEYPKPVWVITKPGEIMIKKSYFLLGSSSVILKNGKKVELKSNGFHIAVNDTDKELYVFPMQYSSYYISYPHEESFYKYPSEKLGYIYHVPPGKAVNMGSNESIDKEMTTHIFSILDMGFRSDRLTRYKNYMKENRDMSREKRDRIRKYISRFRSYQYVFKTRNKPVSSFPEIEYFGSGNDTAPSSISTEYRGTDMKYWLAEYETYFSRLTGQ